MSLSPDRRWDSITWQVTETAGLGALNVQLQGSIDDVVYYDLIGSPANPTVGGDINPTEFETPGVPGDAITLPAGQTTLIKVVDVSDPEIISYRFFKLLVRSKLADKNRQAQVKVAIYAR